MLSDGAEGGGRRADADAEEGGRAAGESEKQKPHIVMWGKTRFFSFEAVIKPCTAKEVKPLVTKRVKKVNKK